THPLHSTPYRYCSPAPLQTYRPEVNIAVRHPFTCENPMNCQLRCSFFGEDRMFAGCIHLWLVPHPKSFAGTEHICAIRGCSPSQSFFCARSLQVKYRKPDMRFSATHIHKV